MLSLDAEFLAAMPGSVRYAHDFMERRNSRTRRLGRTTTDRDESVVCRGEHTGTVGADPDHRRPLRADKIEGFTRALAAKLGVEVAGDASQADNDVPEEWLAALVSDLQSHRGASLVIAGDGQAAAVHALAHAINRSLGNVGSTVEYIPPVEAEPVDQLASLSA